MDVLTFECDEYRLTVSTASIENAWERFVRRVCNDALTYCDYRSSESGKLQLYKVPGSNELDSTSKNEWTQLWPVLFETCEYQFAVEFKNLNADAGNKQTPRVRHQIKNVSDSFKFYPSGEGKGILVGNIDFLNSPGKFMFAFEYCDSNGVKRNAEMEMYVASPKLDTKNDLQRITALINQEYENYVFDYLTLTFSSFSLQRTERNNNIIWLSIFKSVVDDYFRSVKFIMLRPNNKSVRKIYHSRPDRIRRWSQQEEERYKNMGRDAEMHYFRYEQTENTLNTRENRFVKYSLHVLGRKFREVFSEVSSLYSDMAQDERESLASYNKMFHKLESDVFFRKVGEFEGFRQESAILQQRTGYCQIYKAWMMLKNSLDLVAGKTDIGMKKIWELYEIWCFLIMKRLIADILEIDLNNDEGLITEDKGQMINTFINSDLTHTVAFTNKRNGDIIKLEYQHTYNRRTGEFHTSTTEQRPDIVVSIQKPDGFVLTYLYDAKYRVQDDKKSAEIDDGVDIDIADYPLPDAINQMHRYRDAIYYSMKNDERPRAKEIIGGYILFPGRTEGDSIKNRYFYKSIEKVNIGAFPLLPASNNNPNSLLQCSLLEEHLRRIILDETVYEQIKDSVPQRGLSYSLRPKNEDSLVLIGYAKSEDWQKIVDNKLYYTRAELEKGSLRLQPGIEWTKYLLIHDAKNMKRELYKLNEKGPRIVSKQTLVDMGFTPQHGEFFLAFDLDNSASTPINPENISNISIKNKYAPYFVKYAEVFVSEPTLFPLLP